MNEGYRFIADPALAASRLTDMADYGSEMPSGAIELLQPIHKKAYLEQMARTNGPLVQKVMYAYLRLCGMEVD